MKNKKLTMKNYDAIILAVAHREFKDFEKALSTQHSALSTNLVIYDIKGFFDKSLADGRL